MLRRSSARLIAGRHSLPTAPKYSDKPGMWGPDAGPMKDTLSRRARFWKIISMKRLGQFTGMFKTKENVWRYRVFQARLWKGSVFFLMGFSLLMMGNIWCMLAYHAYSVGPSTPILERKVKEHKISKQIMGMVREREMEINRELEETKAHEAIAAQK